MWTLSKLLLLFCYSEPTFLKGNQHLSAMEGFQELFQNVLRAEMENGVYKTNKQVSYFIHVLLYLQSQG